MDKIAQLTQEFKKLAKDKATFKEALDYKFDLIDRINDIEDAASEGVKVDPRQLIAAKKELDLLQILYAPELEAKAKRGGMIGGGILGALAGGYIAAGGLKGGLIGAGIGALGLGALGRRAAGGLSREETRGALRRETISKVRKLDRMRTIDNLKRAVHLGERRGQMQIARAGASKTDITNVNNMSSDSDY